MNNLVASETKHGHARSPFRINHQIIEIPDRGSGSLGGWISIPDHIDVHAPPLVAVHGIHRDARTQVQNFGSVASSLGRVVVAPLFDSVHFRGYQQVVLKCRADIALFDLMNRIRDMGIPMGRRIDLFGYSGGAQFAHRLAMLYPQHITRLNLAAAGWYTFPDNNPYPYGLGKRKKSHPALGVHLPHVLEAFLQLQIRVHIGLRDNEPDINTRRNSRLDIQQGTSRLERARAWTSAIRRCSARMGIDSDIQLEEIKNCSHSFIEYFDLGNLEHSVFSQQSVSVNH